MAGLAAAALLAAGLVLVVAGAELFFEGLLALAARLRVSAFALTAVVSGFELENVAAGLAANAKGLPDAAAGTFLGGATFLALGVAGLAAVTAPIAVALPWPVYGWTAVSPLPLLVLARDGELSRTDGALLLVWFAVSLTGLARAGGGAAAAGVEHGRRRRPVLALLAGLGLLTAGGEVLGEGIRRTVSQLGVAQSLLGNTVVAASVEAEEVARVAVPARRGRGDVALGNLLGTVLHFLTFNAAVLALVRPLELGHETRVYYLPTAVGSVVLLAGLTAWRRGLGRVEGAALLVLYAAFLGGAIAISRY